jgi:hypothetical protein
LYSVRSSQWGTNEIVEQIHLAHKQSGVSGHIHYSMKCLMREGGLGSALASEVYSQPALVPACPWLDCGKPGKATLTVADDKVNGLKVSWTLSSGMPAQWWLVQTQTGREWKTEVLPGTRNSRTWNGVKPEVIAVTGVDRRGCLGPSATVQARGR